MDTIMLILLSACSAGIGMLGMLFTIQMAHGDARYGREPWWAQLGLICMLLAMVFTAVAGPGFAIFFAWATMSPAWVGVMAVAGVAGLAGAVVYALRDWEREAAHQAANEKALLQWERDRSYRAGVKEGVASARAFR